VRKTSIIRKIYWEFIEMDTKTSPGTKTDSKTSMLASYLYGVRDIRLEQAPIPVPGPGEVLLKIASVGICGSDVHYYLEGRIGSQVVKAPIIMGHEFSAFVAGLGEGVAGLGVGQLVTVEPGISCGKCESCIQGHPNLCPQVRFCGTPPVDGVFAGYSLMPAENCFPLPSGFSADDGAMLEPLGIAIHTIDLANLKPGNTVAILGAGPIGLLCSAVARAAGAAEIYMTEPLAYRREFASRYGASAVFNPDEQDVVAEIKNATHGRGVDVAIEAAGASETPQQGAQICRPGGKLILAGIPADDRLNLNASTIRHRGLTIKVVRRMKHTYPRAIRLVSTGQVDLKPIVTHLFSLESLAEAFEMVAAYQDGVVKAVVRINE
jgi:L-iditol 2-dehydrogenase